MSKPSLPTPDFYQYPWQPLSDTRVDGEFVILRWPDGVEMRAYGWWLRENVVADGATDPTSREGTLDPARLPDDLGIASAVVDDHGALRVRWAPDGFTGSLHPGWLHHVATGQHAVSAWLPQQHSWTAADLTAPATFRGSDVLSDDETLRAWLRAMVRDGIGRLRGLPTEEDTVLTVASRIGPQRDTNFGRVWSVKAEILGNEDNSTANTALRLGPHTDLPTREVPPGFQFLHCLVNTCEGGWSRMCDGAAVAEFLAREEPATYEALVSLRWVFFNRSREHDHRWSGPMIDRGAPGSPLTIRAFYPVRAFPDMPDADIPRAYRAAKRFHELCAEPRFQIGYPFAPGDLVAFDNRRLLHARDAFSPTQGRRHLRGCYVDHDEVYSRLRVLERRHAAASR